VPLGNPRLDIPSLVRLSICAKAGTAIGTDTPAAVGTVLLFLSAVCRPHRGRSRRAANGVAADSETAFAR
jgi:hypothetical protein